MIDNGLTKVNAWNKNRFGENFFTEEAGPTINSNTNNNTNSNTTNFMSSMGGMDNMMQMGQQMHDMIGNIGEKFIARGKESKVGNAIGSIDKFTGAIYNALFGAKFNKENIAKFENENTAYNNATFGSGSSSEVLANFANTGDLTDINKKAVGSEGLFSHKVTNKTNALNAERQNANAHKQYALNQSAADLDTNNDNSLMANYAAYGGLLNKYDNGGGFTDWWQNQGSNQFFGAWGNPGKTNQARIARQQGYTGAASQFGGANNAMAYAAAAQSIGNNLINWKNEDYVKSNLGSNAGQASTALFGIANMLTDNKSNRPTLEEKIGLAYGGPVNKLALGGSDYSQIAATAVNLANNFAVQADTKNIDDIQNQIKRRGNIEFTGSSNDDLVNSWGNNYRAYNSSNITDSDFRDKSWAHDIVNGVQAGVEGSTTGFQTGGIAGAIVGGVLGTGSSIAGSLIGRRRAKKKKQTLISDIANTNERQVRTFDVMRSNLDRSNDLNARALDYAFGGPFKKKYADGGYTVGQTYDLSDNEIQALLDAGYHIQYE